MDIFIFAMLVMMMMAMGVLARDFQFIGLIAGIGLLMIAFSIQTSGLDVQTGINITTNSITNVTTITQNYASMFTYYSGLTFMKDLLTIVLSGIGVLFAVYSLK